MVGFESPLFLLLIPVAAGILYYFLLYDVNGEVSERRRYAIFGSRLVIVALLILVISQPFVVETTTELGDETVKMLVDGSDSMEVFEDVSEDLAARIERQGVDVTTRRVASGSSSPLGNALLSNVERNDNVLLVTDGRVTEGRSLEGAAEAARGVGARVNAVNLTVNDFESYVTIEGSEKASVGVEQKFEVRYGGSNLGMEAGEATVTIDGEQVTSQTVGGEVTSFEFSHTFDSPGDYRMVARLEDGGEGVFETNNVYRKTIRAVEPPRVLYVGDRNYPFREFLGQLYDVDTRSEVPSDLSDYYAVVIQNTHANNVGDVTALQEFVIDGGGLYVTGGPSAYEGGEYRGSILGDMVPVRTGEGEESADVVLLLDISGSTENFQGVIKGLAFDALDSMGDQVRVGVVAFDYRAFNVHPMTDLATGRGDVRGAISRLSPEGGGTDINVGLRGAEDMLGGSGNIVLISDGIVSEEVKDRAVQTARRLNERNIRITAVGMGELDTDEDVMRRIAEAGGGSFFRATDAERLSVLFGGDNKEVQGDKLTIMDTTHFITQGVETSGDLPNANQVTVRPTGNFLVATGSGETAMASGRYGLGRVVSVTAYAGQGFLGNLLQEPDSLLLSRSVNWAVGDPERLSGGVFDVEDTRVGEATQLTYRGSSRPNVEGVEFKSAGDNEYIASVTSTEPGFESVGETEYAVNYAREYGGFRMANTVRRAVRSTGGGVYEPSEAARMAEEVRTRQTEPRETQRGLEWIPLVLAILLYAVEVCLRRLYDVYGYSVRDVYEEFRQRSGI